MAERVGLPPGLAQMIREEPCALPGVDGPCWTWCGSVDRQGRGAGYGRIGRAERAHRIVYTLLVGPIGRGLELDHLCKNRACVRPQHLEPVTHAENMARLRATHCSRGHALTGRNLDKSGATGRTCRTCRLARRRAARAEGRNA